MKQRHITYYFLILSLVLIIIPNSLNVATSSQKSNQNLEDSNDKLPKLNLYPSQINNSSDGISTETNTTSPIRFIIGCAIISGIIGIWILIYIVVRTKIKAKLIST